MLLVARLGEQARQPDAFEVRIGWRGIGAQVTRPTFDRTRRVNRPLSSIVGLVFFLFFGAIGVGGTILWVWMLIDCATKEPSEGNDKVVWLLVILFTHFIGGLIYFFVRRPQRIHLYGA